jgi:hypothetical protein
MSVYTYKQLVTKAKEVKESVEKNNLVDSLN